MTIGRCACDALSERQADWTRGQQSRTGSAMIGQRIYVCGILSHPRKLTNNVIYFHFINTSFCCVPVVFASGRGVLLSRCRIGFIHNPLMILCDVFVSEMAAQTPPARLIRDRLYDVKKDMLFLESWSEFEARRI